MGGRLCNTGISSNVRNDVMDKSPYSELYLPPKCNPSMKPILGQWFQTFEDGIEFYRSYATVVGFDICRSSTKKDRNGEVVMRYVVCACEGFHQPVVDKNLTIDMEVNSTPPTKRRRDSKRVGCSAKITLKKQGNGGVIIFRFQDLHGHRMCSESSKPFLRANRKVDIVQQKFIANCDKANIGPTSCFKLYKESVGRCANVRAMRVDFSNFKCDMMAYIGDRDAILVLEKYINKKTTSPGFYFNHQADENDQLVRIFWADPVARRNYACFGDAVSFDATYQTNRYNLVFVPFTGVDNHRKSVTFAAGLIAKEDVESYTWLLENFKKAMVHERCYVVTDQDPAVKIAVARVLTSIRHRFCMWHIMSKVGDKVRSIEPNTETFLRAFDVVVWDVTCTVEEFEKRWHSVLADFGLSEHRWLSTMFELRAFWIPAYFRDTKMGGLLRTTSCSESQNNVFGKCIGEHSSLVEFFFRFEGVIDSQ